MVSFFFLSFFIPHLISVVADLMSTILLHMVWPRANLECRSEMCCMRLTGNAGPKKKSSKIHHLGTIAQLCRAISLQLRHVLSIERKLVKQQYLPHVSLQYGVLQPTSGCDRFVSLGDPSKFQQVSRLGSVLHGTLVVGVGETVRR